MLHIHRAERADGLVAALGGLLCHGLADPLDSEVVAVPTRGMERWLAQQLSSRLGAAPGRADGVCANVLFPAPRRLIADALAAASGVDPDADPWAPERSVWPLLEVVEAALDEPWLHALAAYLRGDGAEAAAGRRDRRLSTVRHLAELFDRYARHRPQMVCAWAAGADHDSLGHPLADDQRWQAQLWRQLRTQIGTPGTAERLHPACERLRAEPALVDLPARVCVFGLTRLAAGELEVLRALAAQRDVHLFLLHPSAELWHKVAGVVTSAPTPLRGPAVPRQADPSATVAANPLLASWGRDAREMQLVLSTGSDRREDHHLALEATPPTLLGRLQAAVLSDARPPGVPVGRDPDARPSLEPDDRSVQIHACHGRARQVEVLRDAVLHLLAEDSTLEPRDVIVMCPDIETFAPLIQATFGAGDPQADDGEPAGVDLHVRLADRSLRQTNPVLSVIAELLELAGQRITASQVLSFADRDPVRRRFGLRDEDLTRLQRWITDAGIRWGFDADHRAPFKLAAVPSGTWQAGLDRLLLGVAMTEEGSRLFADVLPLDDVDSGAIELAGRVTELVARMRTALDALSREQPIAAWARALGTAADALTANSPREAWHRAELQRLLDELLAEAGEEDAPARTLGLGEVRALLAERLAGRPTRANFRTGHLTVCTLYPMRSVPHRVVCLLGLDDGAFPRKTPRDGDDLMLAAPHVGERDPRSEDRQLLLDALMAAQERLIITYTGNDERTNLEQPPAVPVGELLDVVEATVRPAHGSVRDQVVARHPLQPFDRRNFVAETSPGGGPWSFDATMLAGARALSGARRPRDPFLPAPLPADDRPLVRLEDLVRFVQFPVRAFLRQRLRVYVGLEEDEVRDALPVELDGLERWGVGQRLLEATLAGIDGRRALLAEIKRGTLPPGKLGEPVVRKLYPLVERIAACARAGLANEATSEPLDVAVALPGGRLLSGTVNGAWGDTLVAPTFSRLAPKHRLAAWVRLLAATAAAPERPLAAATVGRGSGESVMVTRLAPLAADALGRQAVAREQLAVLVDLYDRGMREPLPLYCDSSAAYAHALRTGDPPEVAARKQWASEFRYDKEDRAPEHRLVLDGERRFEELLEAPPAPDEQGPGWRDSETSRFGRLACRLWDGLLERESVEMS